LKQAHSVGDHVFKIQIPTHFNMRLPKNVDAGMIDEDALMEEFDEVEQGKEAVPAPRTSLYPTLPVEGDRIGQGSVVASAGGSLVQGDGNAGAVLKYPTLPPATEYKPYQPPQLVKDNRGKTETTEDKGGQVQQEGETIESVNHRKDTKPDKQVAQDKTNKQTGGLVNKILGTLKMGRTDNGADSGEQEHTADVPDQAATSGQDNEAVADKEKPSFEEDELAQCWFEAFTQAGLPDDAAKPYALGFSKYGIDDTNAESLTDEDLQEHGISNKSHREMILGLIQSLLESQRESQNNAGEEEIDWDKVEKQQRMLQAEIQHVDMIQDKISKILAGDTERQREFRARLAKERARRDAEREEAKAEFALKKAQRTLDRVKKDYEQLKKM